jgi:hypothetical protein
VHPEWGRVAIDEAIAMYAWHGRHHAAHVERALAALELPDSAIRR